MNVYAIIIHISIYARKKPLFPKLLQISEKEIYFSTLLNIQIILNIEMKLTITKQSSYSEIRIFRNTFES